MRLDESNIYESIPKHARYVVKAAKRRLAEIKNSEEPVGLSTGFATLDEVGVRLVDGELFVVAARMGMGKSSFALQIARNAADELTPQGKSVLIYSCEMTEDAVLFRMASSRVKVNMQAVTLAKASQEDEDRLNEELDRISQLEIVINDGTSPDTSKIASEISDMRENGKPVGLLVVDYLEMLGDTIVTQRETEKIAMIMKRMKAISTKFRIPVILVSQVAREVDNTQNKMPQPSHMSGSRWVETTADKIITLVRPEYYLEAGAICACERSTDSSGIVYVTVLKNRSGKDKFTLRMGWQGETTSLYDLHWSIKKLVRDLSPKKPEIILDLA